MNNHKYLLHIKLSTFFTICIVITSIILKLSVYFKYGHNAVLASTIDSVSDLCASLIAFVAIRYSYKPIDNDHRFGHYKFEAISSLMINFIILISSLFVIYSSGYSLYRNESHIIEAQEVYWVIIYSGIASLIIYLYQSFLYRKTGNLVIKSDAIHYQADFLLNLVVLASVYYSNILPEIDAIAAIVISLYIIYSLKHTLFEAIDQLMDREIADEEKAKIQNIVENYGYQIASFKTRKSGPKIFIQFSINLAADLKLAECEQIISQIKDLIGQQFEESEIFIQPVSSLYEQNSLD